MPTIGSAEEMGIRPGVTLHVFLKARNQEAFHGRKGAHDRNRWAAEWVGYRLTP
jgi:hypothetical protein